MPEISLIAAMTRDRVIGKDNSLPWRLPADMKWFRRHTLGKPIIMGRKTFESFGARPLPERPNIIVTRNDQYQAEDAQVVHSLDQAIQAAGAVEEIMVIGGAQLYDQVIARADRLYITYVDADIDGDAWFPEFDSSVWRKSFQETHAADEKNPYPFRFVIFERQQD